LQRKSARRRGAAETAKNFSYSMGRGFGSRDAWGGGGGAKNRGAEMLKGGGEKPSIQKFQGRALEGGKEPYKGSGKDGGLGGGRKTPGII